MNKADRIFAWVCIFVLGLFLIRTGFHWIDFISYPEVYETYSVPWYTSVEIEAFLTLIVLIGCISWWIYRRKRLQRIQDQPDNSV